MRRQGRLTHEESKDLENKPEFILFLRAHRHQWSMTDKKTYRIWLNPEAPAKIENVRQDFEEIKIEFWNDETKREGCICRKKNPKRLKRNGFDFSI